MKTNTAMTVCRVCGLPLVQVHSSKGHRRKEYCDDACRQKARRQRQEEVRHQARRQELAKRSTRYLPYTQALLERIAQSIPDDIVGQVLAALKHEKEYASTRIAVLEQQVSKLERRLLAVKHGLFRMDTQQHHFPSWLNTQGRFYGDSVFGRKFLALQYIGTLSTREFPCSERKQVLFSLV